MGCGSSYKKKYGINGEYVESVENSDSVSKSLSYSTGTVRTFSTFLKGSCEDIRHLQTLFQVFINDAKNSGGIRARAGSRRD